MGDLLVNESRAYASRLRNTYHYSIQSKSVANTGIRATPGRFSFVIPPYPYPEHQGSQEGIFKLKGFWILNQGGSTDAQRVSGDLAYDVSAFKIRIQGLGLRSNMFNSTESTIAGVTTKRLENSKEFIVINRYANVDSNAADRDKFDAVSGNDEMSYDVLVSNPAGTQVIVDVFNVDDNSKIPDGSGAYYSQLEFSIELLPTEIPNGF